MDKTGRVTLLLIEDDELSADALERMYRQIFNGWALKIERSRDRDEAVIKLTKEKWDLVSLDVCLSGHIAGQDVLQHIALNQSARFVIVFTGIASDDTINGLQRDEGGLLEETVTTLPAELGSLFPGRSFFFQKNRSKDITRDVALIEKHLHKKHNWDCIREACGILNRIERVYEDIWCVVCNGRTEFLVDSVALFMLAKLIGTPGHHFSFDELEDVQILQERIDNDNELAKGVPEDGLTSRQVSGLRMGRYDPEVEIEVMKKNLEDYAEIAARCRGTPDAREKITLNKELDHIEETFQRIYRVPKRIIEDLRRKHRLRLDMERKIKVRPASVGTSRPYNKFRQQWKRFLEARETDFEELWLHIGPRSKGCQEAVRYIKGTKRSGSGVWTYDPSLPIEWKVKVSVHMS